MSLRPYFWLGYGGLKSWQGFEATLGIFLFFFPIFLLWFFPPPPDRNLVLVFPGTLWPTREQVKSNRRGGLSLVHRREGRVVTPPPGLPSKVEREYFWLQGVLFLDEERKHLFGFC